MGRQGLLIGVGAAFSLIGFIGFLRYKAYHAEVS